MTSPVWVELEISQFQPGGRHQTICRKYIASKYTDISRCDKWYHVEVSRHIHFFSVNTRQLGQKVVVIFIGQQLSIEPFKIS